MKAFILSTAIALILVIAVFLNSFLITNILTELSDTLEATPALPDYFSQFSEIFQGYKAKEPFISLSVSHSDLANINDAFAELFGACQANDEAGVKIAKSRLEAALDHLTRLSGINIDSIF